MKKIAATCKRGSSHLTTSKVSETNCDYTYLVHSSYLALGGLYVPFMMALAKLCLLLYEIVTVNISCYSANNSIIYRGGSEE